MDELLPVLVAYLADERARSYLARVALANEVAVLPLADAPVDASLHVVEIHPPGAEPLLLLATPQGPGPEAGFPPRLRPLSAEQAALLFASASPDEGRSDVDDDDRPTLLRHAPHTQKFSSQDLSREHRIALGGVASEHPAG